MTRVFIYGAVHRVVVCQLPLVLQKSLSERLCVLALFQTDRHSPFSPTWRWYQLLIIDRKAPTRTTAAAERTSSSCNRSTEGCWAAVAAEAAVELGWRPPWLTDTTAFVDSTLLHPSEPTSSSSIGQYSSTHLWRHQFNLVATDSTAVGLGSIWIDQEVFKIDSITKSRRHNTSLYEMAPRRAPLNQQQTTGATILERMTMVIIRKWRMRRVELRDFERKS